MSSRRLHRDNTRNSGSYRKTWGQAKKNDSEEIKETSEKDDVNVQDNLLKKATEMLKSKYTSLSNEMKIFLANLYVLQDLKEEARKIFEEVYRDDKWENGLFELGIKAYENNEKYKKRYGEILEECISYQPENIFFIENYASFLVDQEKYKEAAAWFRKINKPYYELIARVNDLLGEKQTDIKIDKSI